MEKKWITSNDEKVRRKHRANEKEGWIPMSQAWKSTSDQYAPSHDIRCRCTSTDRIVGIKSAGGIIDTKNMSMDEVISLCRKNHFCK